MLRSKGSYARLIGRRSLAAKLREKKYGRRFPDLVFACGGERIAIQVGRVTKKGLPVARERRAMSDLWSTGDFDQVFSVPYVPCVTTLLRFQTDGLGLRSGFLPGR